MTVQMDMRPDGSFISKWLGATNDIELTGRWEVQGGIIVMTMTNAQGVAARSLGPPVQRYKVVHINKSEMVFQMSGVTNLITVERR